MSDDPRDHGARGIRTALVLTVGHARRDGFDEVGSSGVAPAIRFWVRDTERLDACRNRLGVLPEGRTNPVQNAVAIAFREGDETTLERVAAALSTGLLVGCGRPAQLITRRKLLGGRLCAVLAIVELREHFGPASC